jgi:hypothetical protein
MKMSRGDDLDTSVSSNVFRKPGRWSWAESGVVFRVYDSDFEAAEGAKAILQVGETHPI